MRHYDDIRGVLDRVRRRWRAWRALQAATRAALVSSLIVGVVLLAARWTNGVPVALAAIALIAFAAAVAGLLWSLLPLRAVPDDRQVARFIEEREPALDDRLVSAVDVAAQPDRAAGLAEPMLADAARRVRDVSVESIVPGETLRRTAFQAVAAALVLAALTIGGRHAVRQAIDAVALTLFPARVTLQVTPGNARIKAGTTLTIEARLVGNTAPVAAQVQVANGEAWRATDMSGDRPGAFRLVLDGVSSSFKYRIAAGAVLSPTYEIAVVRPPRVSRIDVDYAYPAGLNLKPRTERDGGDIYAPAGTDVRLHVITDRPAATGRLVLASGQPLDLQIENAQNGLSASFKVTDDNSYRVTLADAEGMSNAGDTEYFIRMLEDRPPDVRILKPASDKSVTRLEEVDIEAQAEDDYGIDRLELVYSIRGETEQVAPLKIPRAETTVSGRHTLFLEDLDVKPGDFVSYYVRARDLTRGTRPNEARSDIFFLEVKPYEQEFTLAQSQMSASGGGGRNSIDDLVAAQKEIIVATWKLDRRAQLSKNAKSEQDIRSVAQAESELKTRVEQASSGFRETSMRDPRRRPQPQRGGRGAPPPPELKAGETMPEEDEMGQAAAAMAEAVKALEALKTADARRPEMEALNHLLKAQADVKKREVMRQQAGSGAGSNRSNYDLSSLFDKELQKQQQTNYETRTSAEQKEDAQQTALDKVRELARRQDQLLKQQQDLARKRDTMTEEELKRELEKLTREQTELRQRAEDLARQMQTAQSQGQRQNASSSQPGQQTSGGQQARGRQGASSSQGGQGGQQMKDVSEAMRSATNDLRRQDAGQATASGSKALEKLREIEKQMQAGMPDERRRAIGEMQLEARQIADAQRQIASELSKSAAGEAGKDAVRRLAGDQARLSERARALQETMRQNGQSADAAKDVERQKLPDRMEQSADALRAAAERGPGTQRGNTAPPSPSEEARTQVTPQQEMARAFDRVADKLAAATGSPKDAEAGKLSGQLARAQELRDRLDKVSEQMKQLAQDGQGRAGGQDANGQRGAGRGNAQSPSAAKAPGQSGRSGEGQGGGAGTGSELARLREEAQRAMQETRDLMEQLRRDDPSVSRGGAGFTFEGQGMTTSSPGTESFKQDFAKWDDLRRQASTALENAQSAISKKLQAKESKERLAAGADDKAPPEYQKQVDDYFKAIAAKKKGS